MIKPLKKTIVSVLVQNEANVLTRVVNMFGRRGFNIESLTVSPTNDTKTSRITIVFYGTDQIIRQIITQTRKLEVVKDVYILDTENSLYRELLLMKVNYDKEELSSIKEIVDIYRSKIVDLSKGSLIVEMTGTPEKIDGFLEVMHDYDVVEVCRTGITGIESAPKN